MVDEDDRDLEKQILFKLGDEPRTLRYLVDKAFALTAGYNDVDRALRRHARRRRA